MAGPEILTKDDVPLYELGDTTLEMMNVFNEDASRGFIDLVSQEVNSRTFLARTGDMTWDEVAELEHARTGSIEDYQMAFSVDTYAKSLGMTREFIEDSPRELIEDHIAEVIAGGRQKMFDVVFDVMKNGIADGSELWYDPDDYGVHSFTQTHNHTYTGVNNNAADATKVLFDDTSSHTPTEMVRELNHELTHHGYSPNLLLTTSRFADTFIEERTSGHGANYFVPQAESWLNERFENEDRIPVQPNGVQIMQTEWLEADSNGHHPVYLYDTDQNPVKRHTVRPMEMTDNSGAPVGGAGGFRGDPGAMLGAYGSMRFGTKFGDPLAGTKIAAVDPADISTQ